MQIAAILLAIFTAMVPNKKLTPGAIDPRVTQANIQQTICKSGYTKSVRKTPQKMQDAVFAAYGIPPEKEGDYELDHVVSLELGGADVAKNLWPEKYCPTKKEKGMLGMFPPAPCYGAREKDVVETNFKRQVCAGKMTLKEAQKRIAADWLAEYKKIKGL
jgi:hypothetical protein